MRAASRWGDDAERVEPVSGGVANDVWTVRVAAVCWDDDHTQRQLARVRPV